MADKVIAADTETWVLIPAVEVLGDPYAIGVAGKVKHNALTAALLNEYLAMVDRTGATYTGAGGNITLAVKDDAKLSLTASATDNDKAINAAGTVTVPTSQNYDAKLTTFRDKTLASTSSSYNLANDCVRARGVKYLAVRRIGMKYNAVGVAGQKYNSFYVETDNPIDQYGDGNNQSIGVNFVTKSIAVEDAILL